MVTGVITEKTEHQNKIMNNDHGNPEEHPHDEKGGHYHDWKDGKRGPAHLFESIVLRESDATFVGVAVGLFLGFGIIGGIRQMIQFEYDHK